MELEALHKRVVGLDVHQAQITACALIEEADGSTRIERRQFGAFQRDRRELADWIASLHPAEVVMESTGIYWKSPYAALEKVGIRAKVVNARHVKNVLRISANVTADFGNVTDSAGFGIARC